MTCNDPNAKCEYVTNSIRKCMCDYGYKTVAGACEKEIGNISECMHGSSMLHVVMSVCLRYPAIYPPV